MTRPASTPSAGPAALSPVTLRQLHYLAAVAAAGSFSEAARRCHVSQPALVEQLEKLERHLGTLFERNSRGVTLTNLGTAAVTRGEFILRAVRDLDRLAGFPQGLRIGMIETAAPYLMPLLMSASQEKILPVQAKTSDLLERLRGGRLDAAVLAAGTVPPDLAAVGIGDDELLLATLAGDRHIGDRRLPSIMDTADHEMLLLEDGHCLRDQVTDFCATARSTLGPFEAATLEMLVEMVGAGLGVTLIPSIAAPSVRRHPKVELHHLQERPRRGLVLVARRGSDERLRDIEALLRTSVARLQQFEDDTLLHQDPS